MEAIEALAIVRQACERFYGTKQDHDLLQTALAVLESLTSMGSVANDRGDKSDG